MKKQLKELKVGEVFSIAGIEFFKVCEENGNTIVVAKDIIFRSVFGENNNFAESTVLKILNEEVLLKLEKGIGAENIVEHEVDLLSLDGSDKWGKAKCRISIPTFDFYRKHVKVFDKHKVNSWWWLATPDTTSDHCNDNWCACVSSDGDINYYGYGNYYSGGVRPFLFFVSSIIVSCED